MNRAKRIVVGILAPPVVAVVVLLMFESVMSSDAVFITPKAILFTSALSFVFAGMPSVAFAAVMELAFAKGLEVRSWRASLLATGLGLLAGVVIARVIAGDFDNQRDVFSIFPLLGAVTGFIVGWILRAFPSQKPNKAPEPTAPSGRGSS
jgi:hypothetical protein